jgi:hypothetical protein
MESLEQVEAVGQVVKSQVILSAVSGRACLIESCLRLLLLAALGVPLLLQGGRVSVASVPRGLVEIE